MARAQDHPPAREDLHSLATRTPATLRIADGGDLRYQPEGQSGPLKPCIEITTRSDLSLLYRMLRVIIKPLRPRLARPSGPAQPAGSPRLVSPSSLSSSKKKNKHWSTAEIIETKCEGVWMYHFRTVLGRGKGKGRVEEAKGIEEDGESSAAEDRDGNLTGVRVKGGVGERRGTTRRRGFGRKHRVYYFCGGGFQSPPAGEHWLFLAQLSHDLATHRPNGPFVDSGQHSNFHDLDSNAGTDAHANADADADAEIELILVSYPLAPNNPASESLRILRNWLKAVMDQAVENGDTLSLMGDSSGGNVVLSLGFWAVQNYEPSPRPSSPPPQPPPSQQQPQPQLHDPSGPRPPVADDDIEQAKEVQSAKARASARTSNFPLTSLINISGPADLTQSNPEIGKADKLDCVLTAEMTRQVAEVWTGTGTGDVNETVSGNEKAKMAQDHQPPSSPPHEPVPRSTRTRMPLSDPSVSPLLNPDAAFHALRNRKVHVHGVLGTHDVLAPDGLEFMRKCQRLGVTGRWLVWEGQMHCFPLAGGRGKLGIREGREGRQFLVDVLWRDHAWDNSGDI